MSEMIWEEHQWGWDPTKCPADQQLVELFTKYDFKGKRVLHMGTGSHHYVGCSLYDNFVLGLTNCPGEVVAYMTMAMDNPKLLEHYSVQFMDVHMFPFEKYRSFDVITLFHLGEYPVGDYAHRDEAGVIEEAILGLSDNGLLIQYMKSSAHDRVDGPFADITSRWMQHRYDYKDLRVWQKV